MGPPGIELSGGAVSPQRHPSPFTDHRDVLAAAIRQALARFRRKILIRVDGAGRSPEGTTQMPV